MLTKRIITILVLAVIGIPVIILGGVPYFVVVTFFLGVAAWEYGHIFGKAGSKISEPILIGSVILIETARMFFPNLATAALVFSIFAAMTWHLLTYEEGRDQAASDFAVTTTGIVYIGWIGAYLLDLRNMPSGMWWLLVILPAIWVADVAAYLVGSRFGKHFLSRRLSPKKTWEGYWAGVVFSTLATAGLVVLWHSLGGPAIAWWKGAALGAALSTLSALGDLGESMFKRQAGVKDASNFFPGHGGVLDRIDSWLWGGVLGYFLVTWFLIKGL
ncbi:MAG: phosphatidate cytidylyltransferase [Anaerolineales bacterium]